MRCAEISLVDEPLAGTAPEALGVVLVEHPGPWGEKALREAGLGELEASCKALGLKALLVRRADRTPVSGRAYLAWCGPEPFLVEVAPEAVSGSLDALARGEAPRASRAGERLWLVCTNGKRDTCCARDGVPVARALAAQRPEDTWECTHLGGHRFAANVVLLPDGLCFGRVDEASAGELLARIERDELPVELLRGRMALPPAAQTAEIAARESSGVDTLAPLDVQLEPGGARVGDIWVELVEEPLAPRPVSCGAEPEPVTVWRARAVTTA
jgi:hypothetical protein